MIKFRVWDFDKQRMYNQDELSITFDKFGEDVLVYTDDEIRSLYDYKLMQNIGLKDKNGKEIYEGDIVEFSSMFHPDTVYVGMIKYYKGEFQIEWLDEEINIRWDIMFWVEERIAEIIGNIYENKDLLEGNHEKESNDILDKWWKNHI